MDPEKLRDKTLRSRYGISAEDFDTMAEKQGGECAICRDTPEKLFVDHCHDTGQVRGLLCNRCNLGLGKFRDDPALLEAALEYLRVQHVAA